MKPWVMTLPVISTAHVPSAQALYDFCQNNASATNTVEHFCFAYIDVDHPWEGDEAWVQPIADWVGSHYKDGWDSWIRIDADGDLIPELPTYEW